MQHDTAILDGSSGVKKVTQWHRVDVTDGSRTEFLGLHKPK